jgi:hypothetical protein
VYHDLAHASAGFDAFNRHVVTSIPSDPHSNGLGSLLLRGGRRIVGIAKAKAAGVYKGRPPSIEASRVRERRAQGMRPSDRQALKIGRASVYRVLGQRADKEAVP